MTPLKRIQILTKVYLINFSYYYFLKFYHKRIKSDKVIVISLSVNYFSRYLYGLIKFLHLNGYSIFLEINFKFVSEILQEHEASFIFSEHLVNLGKPRKKIKAIYVDDSDLSPDYFSQSQNSYQSAYYIPMMQHPLMYHKGWWNTALSNSVRKKSIFMAGNFSEVYQTFEKDGLFKMNSRREVYSFLKQKQMLYEIESINDLSTFLNSATDNKIIIIDRLKVDILMNELRDVLSRFNFFFALPGIEMPFSHNVIEAMSCGCIPFIQKEYADMFKPQLKNGITAITFLNTDDVENRIAYLFNLTSAEIELMRNNVFDYYNEFLTPEKVVAALEKNNFSNIYLQAEHHSVELLKKNRLIN